MYIPPGYQFRPYHEELIDHYLYNKHPDYVICQIDCKGARLKKQQQQDPNCLEPFVVEQPQEEHNCIEPYVVEQQYVVEHQTEEGNCLEQHVVEHQAEEEQQKVDGIMTEPVTDFYFDIDNIDVDVPEANDFLFAKEIDTFLSQLNNVPSFMSWPV
uniref:Uncharacterized protein n=1 Tax=Fagus sylvatica TaxID=28930 RepID=A0A2N9HHP0_FAGSY